MAIKAEIIRRLQNWNGANGNYLISGDIFISVDRVKDNAQEYDVSFHVELLRVMCHGVLHYCGYKDKTAEDEKLMREKEQEKMNMFHVEL